MFHSRIMNNKINRYHEIALRLVYSDEIISEINCICGAWNFMETFGQSILKFILSYVFIHISVFAFMYVHF